MIVPAEEGELGGETARWADFLAFARTAEELASEIRRYAEEGISHLQLRVEPCTPAGIAVLAPVLELLDRG